MNTSQMKILKVFLTSMFLILSFTSCSVNSISHKNVYGSNNFHSLVKELVDKSANKLKRHLSLDEVVLVSDFVNLDKLRNRSKLGFLLSDHLKDSLLNKNIIVREVELSEEFQYGKHGFNVLTRKQKDINKRFVNSKFAIVGTYSITTKSLIVFIKLIDITNGNILSSANGITSIDEEILDLENKQKTKRIFVRAPLVL
jgi:hypothetical protein